MASNDVGLFSGRSRHALKLSVKQWLQLSHDWTSNHGAEPESVAESLSVLPCHSVASADWTRVFLSVSDDSGTRGILFIHDVPITEPRAIVGWMQEAVRRFIVCDFRNCISVDGGFYRVRLFVDEVIRLESENVQKMYQILEN
jgi:hypothetical protein